MATHNPRNERIKHQYFAYLKEAGRYSEASVDAAAGAIAQFEEATGYRDFRMFHTEQAIAFKRRLVEGRTQRGGKPLSQATRHHVLGHLKKFFHWLAGQPGYRRRISYSDSEYFNLSEKDTRIATARREQPYPTLEQVRRVILGMPANTDLERRNRALLAFTLLTAARVGAIATLKLKHVDLVQGCVLQDAREVRTKFSKTFTTYFCPVGDDVCKIFEDWVLHLRNNLLWGNDDPLFPATSTGVGPEGHFSVMGLKREHWRSTGAIRDLFREAFTVAGLPYFNPHSFRNTLTKLGEALCQTPEEFKAWSQNLGHEGVMTTFKYYGAVPGDRQREIIRGARGSDHSDSSTADEITEAVLRVLRRKV